MHCWTEDHLHLHILITFDATCRRVYNHNAAWVFLTFSSSHTSVSTFVSHVCACCFNQARFQLRKTPEAINQARFQLRKMHEATVKRCGFAGILIFGFTLGLIMGQASHQTLEPLAEKSTLAAFEEKSGIIHFIYSFIHLFISTLTFRGDDILHRH